MITNFDAVALSLNKDIRIYSHLFFLPYIPTGIATSSLVTTTGCFSYKERINDRRQTARAVASETELPDTSASSMARASGAVNKSLIVLSKVVYTP